MKLTNTKIWAIIFAQLFSFSLFAQELNINYLSTYHTGIFDDSAAEIVAYDKNGERLFFVNASNKSIDVLDISNPELPVLINQIDITPYGGGVNSVDVYDNFVAAAIENDIKTDPGAIVFFDTDGNYINQVVAGALPDMLIISEDGQKVVAANEGEPNDDYNVDPEGSVTIVDISAGVENAVATQVTFESYNDKKASLMNRGVRIFGNDGLATVAQDLEPEYVAFSADGNLAYVSCQENNALVVIDIEQGIVLDILALGFKDHDKGGVKLNQYFLNDIPWYNVFDLGTPVYDGAETVKLGGFSGLCYDPLTSTPNQLSFWAVPDRGPNDATVNAGLSRPLRPFKLPNYESRLVKLNFIKSLNMFFIDANPIYLKRPDGITPISGKGNIQGVDEVPVTPTDDTYFTNVDYSVNGVDYHALDYDAYGGDFEGVIRVVNYDTKDFTFWLCDEYRPAIYHFDENGVMINRFVPEGTSLLGDNPQAPGFYGEETLPAVYNKRMANRGFEAIAYDYDENIIYAFIQSPLNNPDNSVRNNTDVIRILGIDPVNGQPVKEFVYLLERNKYPGLGLSRVDKIGDAVYAGKGKFYVLERDSSTPDDGESGKKFIFEINTQGATNILGTALANKMTSADPDDKTLEMMSADDLYNAGIKPVFKVKVLNLPSIGYLPGDKAEGLALLPNGDLVVLNDNDFGLAGAGISDNSSMGFIEFQYNYGFDASDRDDEISITPRPTLGMYLPDAMVSYVVNGKTYILTANEGDARDYDGYSEEDRVKDLVLDPFYFPNATWLQEDENLGRLKTTYANGDIDMDGMNEYIFSYGARSFSIWDEFGNQVFDSGDQFEQHIKENFEDYFNSNNSDNDSKESRSDDKGVEPEAITVAEFDGKPYAFIGFERMGGVMAYDISNPYQPEFVEYINNRNFSVDADSPDAGDLGVENIVIIKDEDSPNGQHLMVTANEVSGTVSIFTIDGDNTFDNGTSSFAMSGAPGNSSAASATAYPNPFKDQFEVAFECEAENVTVNLYDQFGRLLNTVFQGSVHEGLNTFEVKPAGLNLPSGIYMISLFSENNSTQTISVLKE